MSIKKYSKAEKDLFYAEMGHDLRQPLQAVKILLSLLKDDSQSLSQFELISKIENSMGYLESGIDNLLEAARMEGSLLKQNYQKIRLDEILFPIAEEYRLIAVYKNLDLKYHGKRAEITTDGAMLARIVRNLLHNAIKFSRSKISLHWYELPDKIRIIIRDNGLGLKKEECSHLFKAYYQCPRDRKNGQGCGLGLAIVKELTEALSIELKLKSKWKKGTIFTLTLPKK